MENETYGKVGIIMPVYNAEKTLQRAVDCLKGQSFDDLTILMVDDGSTDRSAALCDEVCRQDARFRVLHQKNGGVSAARNAGLDFFASRCEYLMFMDADDVASPFMVEQALQAQRRYPGDVIAWESSPDEEAVWNVPADLDPDRVQRYDFDHMLDYYFTWNICPVWNKIFKAERICADHLRFREDLTISEDTIFVMDYLHSYFDEKNNGGGSFCWKRRSTAMCRHRPGSVRASGSAMVSSSRH